MNTDKQLELLADFFNSMSKEEANEFIDGIVAKHSGDISVEDYFAGLQENNLQSALQGEIMQTGFTMQEYSQFSWNYSKSAYAFNSESEANFRIAV